MAESPEEQWVQEGIEIPLDEPQQTFGQFLLERVRSAGDKVMLEDGETGERVSGEQLVARSVAVAHELRARGVGPGDVVCAGLDNTLLVSPVVLGVLFSGAVYSPFNPDLGPDDLRHVMQMLEPRLIFCEARSVSKVRSAARAGAQVVSVRTGNDDWEPFLRLAPGVDPAAFQAHGGAHPEDTVCIMCSSGTTGPPKGVLLSQRVWHYFAQFVQFSMLLHQAEDGSGSDDVALQVTPNFWMSGFVSNIMNALTGTKTIVHRRFDVDEVLASVERHRVNNMLLAPVQIAAIAKHPNVERYDTRSLRTVAFGGAAVSQPLRARAEQRLGLSLMQIYGQTECLQGIFPGPLSPDKPTSVGAVAPNCKAKIVDFETGKTLGPHKEGEIWIKSDLVFSGYYKNPEATKDAIDLNGWIHTGDVGYIDEDGYFYICDRYKELIKYRGIHVAPAEIEALLVSHDGVRDAAVVGIENDEDQEHPVGFVVRQEGHGVTAHELHKMLKEHLPEYKQLHGGLHFVPDIPRTASGKIKRRLLRQQARTLRSKL